MEMQFCMLTVAIKNPYKKIWDFPFYHVKYMCVNLVNKNTYLESITFFLEMQFSKWRLENKISLFVLIMVNLIWVHHPTIFRTITKYENWMDVGFYFTCIIHMWKLGITILIKKEYIFGKKILWRYMQLSQWRLENTISMFVFNMEN